MDSAGETFKATISKALVIKINIAIVIFLLVACVAVVRLRPASIFNTNVASLVECALRDCHSKKVEGGSQRNRTGEKMAAANEKTPSFLRSLRGESMIGLVNMADDDVIEWGIEAKTAVVEFERVSENIKWNDLFPEWVDEEEVYEGTSCPEIPMPDFAAYEEMDVVVVKLQCRTPDAGWNRDVFRLQVHLVAANLAVKKGKRDWRGMAKLAFLSNCEPMRELFRCDDMAAREGEWWMYEAQMERLEEKVRLPLGSCMLALPLWGEGINEEFNVSKLSGPPTAPSPSGRCREAYVTVLHSKENYVCGAIMLAHRLRKTGTDRDLVLLHDKSIGPQKLQALAGAGWELRQIERIRSPHAKRGAYNEYNYSKLRIWQLAGYYDKVVFVDSDVLVLRSLDHLFRLPQMSATGNSRAIFNSGVMVIEPSNCTFDELMLRREDVVSYNGGDQGFLNEMFAWWHRLPRRANFLKMLWRNTTEERRMKDQLYAAEPATLFGLHYLGIKPWRCYRDYDCNWNVDDQRRFASDAAHAAWWRRHDEMDEGMRRMCGLTAQRKQQLERERRKAEAAGYRDGHWRINVSDWRKDALIHQLMMRVMKMGCQVIISD